MPEKLKIIAMLSGGGTTLQNLIDLIEAGNLDAEIMLVVSSKDGVKGLERAKKHGIETAVVASKDYYSDGKPDWQGMSEKLNDIILPLKPDLICLCGFMCFYELPDELLGKVVNIHPSLIPSFCGKGMCGSAVHKAVVKSGVKVSGCTVHFVTNEYDAGPIILQRTCEVYDTDTPEDVAARVFEQECLAYPEAVRLFAEGRLEICGDIVKINRTE